MIELPWYGGANMGATPQPSMVATLSYLINLWSTWVWLVWTLTVMRIVMDFLSDVGAEAH
jgi:hypothetical protein